MPINTDAILPFTRRPDLARNSGGKRGGLNYEIQCFRDLGYFDGKDKLILLNGIDFS